MKVTVSNNNKVGRVTFGKIAKPGTIYLNDLADVVTTGQQDGDVLVYQANDSTYVVKSLPSANLRVLKAGDTMTGNLIMSGATINVNTINANTIVAGGDLTLSTASSSNGNVIIVANGQEVVRVTDTKRIGLNTIDPAYELDIQAPTDATIRIAATGTTSVDDAILRLQIGNGNASGYILFGDNVDDAIGTIRYNHENDTMSFETNNIQKLTMNDNGIGVGTPNPLANLHVIGNTIISKDLTISGNLTVEGNTTTLNVQTLEVEDNDITLNSNTTGIPVLNASITIDRGTLSNTFLRWNEGIDKWGWSDDGSTFYSFDTALNAYAQANSAYAKANAPITVKEIYAGNSGVVNTFTNINTLQFDADSGMAVVDEGANAVTIKLNSTFKTWNVNGGPGLVAFGLDTVNFVSANGISLSANNLSSPKTFTIDAAQLPNAYGQANNAYTAANNAANTVRVSGNSTSTLHAVSLNFTNTASINVTVTSGASGNANISFSANNSNPAALGPQGYQGVQGSQGRQGAQGFQGVVGAQGPQGAQGFQGVQGSQGFQGAQGVQGAVGAQGAQGFQGAQGVQGAVGQQGSQGFQGVQGAVGAQGAQGVQGAQGAQGAQGVQGHQGFQGVVGAQGPQGFQGVQGSVGAQGAQGVQGAVGAQGPQGIQGATGPQGFQGADGAQGVAGVQGAQGPQGFQGVAGAQGPQGAQGVQGSQGRQGVAGTFGGASFEYEFRTQTNDPINLGSGLLQFNASPFTTATTMYISFNDKNAANVFNFLQTIDDSTSAIKGNFKVANTANVNEYAFFDINGNHIHDEDHFNVPVAYTSGTVTTFANTANITISLTRTGDKGDTGPQGPQGVQGSQGFQGVQGAIGPPPSTTIYSANSIALTGGSYVSGNLASIQTFSDGDQYIFTDGTGTAPAWNVDVDFISVTQFNVVDLNIQYTQNSGHTIYILVYNNNTGIWDTLGSYNGLVGYYQFKLGVISSAPYINSGRVQLRLNHSNQGNIAHQTNIDYIAILDTPAGAAGPRGPQGATGPQGVQGAVGAQGAQGVQGAVGAQGAQGIQGATGPQGPQGVQGFNGTQGAPGAQGPQGFQGVQGAVGAQGAQGVQGADGPQGPQGVQGFNGTQGAPGAQGAQGVQGATGPIGGSNTQILFNNNGTTGGSANLTFNLNQNLFTFGTTTLVANATSGQVSVGTTNPIAKFSVSDTGNWQVSINGTSTTAYTQLYFDATGRNYGIGVGNDAETANGLANDFFIYDHTAGATRFAIDPAGNTIIGATSGTNRLQVNGSIGVTNTTGTVIFTQYGNIFTTSAATLYTVDTFASATFRSAKYFAQMEATVGPTYGVMELNLIHDGTTVWLTQYGENKSNASANLGIFDATITAGDLNLTYTPGSVYPAQTVKVVRLAVTD